MKPSEALLLEAIDVPHAFSKAVVAAVARAGGRPLCLLKSNEIQRALMMAGTQEQWDTIASVERLQMESVQCYLGARGNANVSELSDVPADKHGELDKGVPSTTPPAGAEHAPAPQQGGTPQGQQQQPQQQGAPKQH